MVPLEVVHQRKRLFSIHLRIDLHLFSSCLWHIRPYCSVSMSRAAILACPHDIHPSVDLFVGFLSLSPLVLGLPRFLLLSGAHWSAVIKYEVWFIFNTYSRAYMHRHLLNIF